MTGDAPTGDDRSGRIDEALADYLRAIDAGRAPDPTEFAARFPDLAPELGRALADAGLVDAIVAPARPGPSPPPTGVETTQSITRGADATVDFTPPGSTPDATRPDGGEPAGDRIGYFGDYELIKVLGQGGMGVVYKAVQISLNRPVALKMIRGGVLADGGDRRRFQNEAEAVARLDHPGIVPIYEVGEHDGRPYFSMRLIPGGGLDRALAAYKADPRSAARLMIGVAEAVHHAHQRGILHRDLKPANVLLDDRGEPHVTDFGLAKRVDGDSELTASGAILGTPAYMAPEQASGRRGAVTTLTDVYGLGAILYALLAGRAPFRGDSVLETLEAVRARAPEPPSRLNGRVPRDLEVICLACLEKEPRLRFPSAQALADDLRRFVAGEPIAIRPVGQVERFRLWCRRNPVVAALAGGLSLAMLAGTIVSLYFAREARQGQDAAEKNASKATAFAEQLGREKEQTEQQAGQIRDYAGQLEREQEVTETSLYGAEMGLALRDLDNANYDRVRRRLEAYRPKSSDGPDRRGFEWFYLERLLNPVPLSFKFPQFTMPKSLSLNGRVLANQEIGSRSYGAWDIVEGRPLQRWTALGEGSVLALDRDGRSLATTRRRPPTILIRDVASGHEVRSLRAHEAEVHALAFRPEGGLLASADLAGVIKLWDIPERDRLERTLKGHEGPISSLLFRPDGRILASCGLDGTARLWDVPEARERAVLGGHAGLVGSAAFSPDGRQLLTVDTRATARLWDVESGRLIQAIRGPMAGAATFGPGGPRVLGTPMAVFSWLAAIDRAQLMAGIPEDRGRPRVWDAQTGRVLVAFSGSARKSGFAPLAHPDGRRVILPDAFESRLQVLDASQDPVAFAIVGGDRDAADLAVGPDGRVLATIGSDDLVRLHDLEDGWLVATLDGHRGKSPQRARVDDVVAPSRCFPGRRPAGLGRLGPDDSRLGSGQGPSGTGDPPPPLAGPARA
ncbi:MAG: serine/threonine-protein kinase [Isosphaeraceae bacterium]